MTNREAVKTLLTGMFRDTMSNRINIDSHMEDDFLYAIGMAISVLMKQEEEKGKHCKCQNDS